jgi:hypothetical protein
VAPAKIVSPLAAEAEKRGLELEILTRGKDVAENEALWANALAGLKGVRRVSLIGGH